MYPFPASSCSLPPTARHLGPQPSPYPHPYPSCTPATWEFTGLSPTCSLPCCAFAGPHTCLSLQRSSPETNPIHLCWNIPSRRQKSPAGLLGVKIKREQTRSEGLYWLPAIAHGDLRDTRWKTSQQMSEKPHRAGLSQGQVAEDLAAYPEKRPHCSRQSPRA